MMSQVRRADNGTGPLIMQNLEFKAELRDIEAARRQCALMGAERVALIDQMDEYFRLVDGRLKRRTNNDRPPAWIFYHRTDDITPCISTCTVLTDEQARRRWGTQSLHQWLTVRKKRELWRIGPVRIQLDDVERLGLFIEFEIELSKHLRAKEARQAMMELRESFEPVLGEPVSASYSDLMEQETAEQT